MRRLLMYVLMAYALAAGPPAFAQNIPALTSHFLDEAGVLTPDEAGGLRNQLENLEARTTARVVIYTVKSLQGYSLFDFTHKAARTWKPGTAQKSNGVVIVYHTGKLPHGETRIHIGKGLEGDIPDAAASRIIRAQMNPHFQKKEYAQAFTAAVDALDKLITGESESPEKVAERQTHERESAAVMLAAFLAFGIAFILLVVANAYGRTWGGAVGTGSFAGAAWLIALTNPAILIAAIIGLILGIFIRDMWDMPWCMSGCGDAAGSVLSGAGEFLGAGASG